MKPIYFFGIGLVRAFCVFACLALSLIARAEPLVQVGQVIFAVGQVQVGSHTPVSLKKGQAVYAGQTIMTGANGHVHLKMVDDAFLSIRPNSVLKIDVSVLLENNSARQLTMQDLNLTVI